jgi:NAD(P)-dependent dehydrogenase (short-subunit alcohol dehydrogenase family)
VERFDVGDDDGWARALAVVARVTGNRLDLLFNNAGAYTAGPCTELTPARHASIVSTNPRGTIYGIRARYPLLRQTAGARIVNNASFFACHGVPGAATYSTTKAAIRALTEALDLEFRPAGIRVSDILPGFVETGFFGAGDDRASADFLTRLGDCGARFVFPEHLAEAVWRLAHGRSGHRPVGWQAHVYALPARYAPALARRQSRRAAACFFGDLTVSPESSEDPGAA